jgi:two-component system chemotaxis response regulator CheB
MLTSRGPKENLFRPSIDVLFRSAAVAWGPRVIGVSLTGDLDDGVAGLAEIKSAGGLALVQEPSSALAPSMPRNALQRVDVDHVVRLEEIAPLLVSLAGTAARERGPASARARTEVRMSLHESVAPEEFMQPGEPSIYACPECHGPLMAMKDRGFLRFRCHTGPRTRSIPSW